MTSLISRRCAVVVQCSRRAPGAICSKLLRAKNYFRHANSKVRMRCLDLGLRQAILLLHFLSSAVANRNSQAFSFCIRRYIKVVASCVCAAWHPAWIFTHDAEMCRKNGYERVRDYIPYTVWFQEFNSCLRTVYRERPASLILEKATSFVTVGSYPRLIHTTSD